MLYFIISYSRNDIISFPENRKWKKIQAKGDERWR